MFSNERYDALVLATFKSISELAKLKGAEYSGDTDRLLNFRRLAADLDLPMESVWRVYAAKHWDAVGQYVRDLQTGKQRTRSEPIGGRVDDLIVYLLLFKAMVEERNATARAVSLQPGTVNYVVKDVESIPVQSRTVMPHATGDASE